MTQPEATGAPPTLTAGWHTPTPAVPYTIESFSKSTAETFQTPEVLMNGKATNRADEPVQTERAKSFNCHVTYFDDSARVTAKGCLDRSTVPVLRRMVLAAAVLPISGVTLDLDGVDEVDRYAVNALVALRHQVRDRSAAFALASISPPVRRALDVAGVCELFDHESIWSSYPSPGAVS